jgi:S1-C subfamily serine protease
MTSQDEITRTADRLKDALGAAADVMTASDSPVWGAAADVISSGDSLVRIRGPQIGHARKWLVPLTAAASVVAIALVAVFVGHPAGNTGGRTVTAAFFGPVHLANVSAPDPAALNSPGVQAARSSVVKITGSAPSCGKSLEGSGFVYAPQHVITTAHEVAGITRGQTVTTAGGVAYRATVVFYDPRTDIAVLDVPGLSVTPLRFGTQASPEENAVVAGYPLDRAFTAVPARIAEVLRAEGTSIYQTGRVDRQVYEIRALVQPGDSGGPLLSPSGTVDGMVQGVDSGVPDTGFALTASYIQADAKAAASATAPVPTQGCALPLKQQ